MDEIPGLKPVELHFLTVEQTYVRRGVEIATCSSEIGVERLEESTDGEGSPPGIKY